MDSIDSVNEIVKDRQEKIKIIESNRQAFDAYCQFVKQVVNDRPKPVESLSLLGALIKEQNSKILSQALMHLNKVPVEAKYSELLRIAQRATLNSQWKCLAYQEYIKLGY
jgi:hypothetical protein